MESLTARRAVLTVSDAIRLPALRAGAPEVVAGERGLGRVIRWAHAGEAPDVASFLKGEELLLMTGMGIPADVLAARRWLASIHDSGASGLVIELGSAFQSVPGALVAEANRLDFPLVVLHRKIAFVEATEAVHRHILTRRQAEMDRGEAAGRRLVDLLVDGAVTPMLLADLAQFLGLPVILARASGAILFQAAGPLANAVLTGLWESHVRRLEDAPHTVSVPVRLGGDGHWADLATLSEDAPPNAGDVAVLERAAPLIAVSLRREREKRAFSSGINGEFLADLAAREPTMTEQEAASRAARLGFERRADLLLPVVVRDCVGHLHDEQWERISAGLRGSFRETGRPAIVARDSDRGGIFLIAGLRDAVERAHTADSIVAILADMGVAGHILSVTVGAAARRWISLGGALRATIDSSLAARWRRPTAWHDAGRPDLTDLLAPLRERDALARFVDAHLAVLMAYDKRHGSQLIETLEAYFAHGGRKAETARALHLERQSLYKRLTRIASLLDIDLDSDETRLALQVALAARRVLR